VAKNNDLPKGTDVVTDVVRGPSPQRDICPKHTITPHASDRGEEDDVIGRMKEREQDHRQVRVIPETQEAETWTFDSRTKARNAS